MAVALDHGGDAVEEGAAVAEVGAAFVVEGVGFDVGLIDDVEAVAVAEVEEVGVVRVMGAADGVDVVPFHGEDIELHVGGGEGFSASVVVVVAVDAVDQDGLSVEEELAVMDFDAFEADGEGGGFEDASVLAEGDAEVAEVRLLRGPGGDAGEVEVEFDGATDAGGGFFRSGGASGAGGFFEEAAAAMFEGDLNLGALGGRAAAQGDGEVEGAGAVVLVEAGIDLDIGEVDWGQGLKMHAAVEAGKPPVVLVLDVGAVGKLDDDGLKEVRSSGGGEGGDVELGGEA
jgi:hypothetical protein